MSKTYWIARGEKIRPSSFVQRKKSGKTKCMGHTKGAHSHGIVDTHWEMIDGKNVLVYTKNDRAPIKDVDFVKYGYPFNFQHRKLIKNKDILKDLDKELKNYGN